MTTIQASTISVRDETRVFWIQRGAAATSSTATTSSANSLVTANDLPLPSIEALLETVAPFEELAARDTSFLQSSAAAELISARDAVRSGKAQIESVTNYIEIRDRVFPLAHSGPMSAKVQNRAAYKLLESMEASGIMEIVFNNNNNNNNNINNNNNDIEETMTASASGSERNQMQKSSKEGGSGGGGGGEPMSKTEKRRRYRQRRKLAKKASRDEEQRGAAGAAARGNNNNNNNARRRSKSSEIVFVDMCGGPGSFAQALLDHVRRPAGCKVRGYGITLDTTQESRLAWYDKLLTRRDFTPTFGLDGTGSVYEPANIEAITSLCAADRAVHFVMGDGGFEVPPAQLSMQESITSRIVFSQWYMGLRLLATNNNDANVQPHGALVLKLFETSSVFLRSLLTLTCLFFRSVAVVKPAHSRVINSERYLACHGFRDDAFTPAWLDYLRQVHARAFADEARAPFTLLPNVAALQTAANAPGTAMHDALRGIEQSVVVTAKRQAVALRMVWDAATSQSAAVAGGGARSHEEGGAGQGGDNDGDDDDDDNNNSDNNNQDEEE